MKFARPVRVAFILASILTVEATASPPDCPMSENALLADYRAERELPADDSVIGIEFKIGGRQGICLHSESSCGAKSCEYSLYIKLDNGCFKPVLDVTGRIEPQKPTDWTWIRVRNPVLAVDLPASESSSYVFDTDNLIYRVLPRRESK